MPDRKRKKPLVPKLRFPEFEDAGEWEICKLGDLLSLEYGFSLPDSRRKDGEIPVIGSNGIVGFHDEAFIDGPAIIIGRKGSVGQVNWIDRGCCPIDTTFYVQRQREDCLLMFLKLILDVAKLSERGDNGAVPGLNRNDVYTIKTALPLEAEQQKIADCLSSLDALIELEAQKCEALKAHKKGLMQQLFPREGETKPRLRFPGFRNVGEWEVKKIEDFFQVLSSKRVLQKDWTTHGVSFYRTRELVSLYKNEPFSSEIFISEELFSELSKKYGVPAAGDFLVSGVGTLGIAYQVQAGDKFYFKDGNVLWFKLKEGIVSTFFKYCFQSDIIQNQILGQTSISTVGTFTIQNAKKTEFLCPCDIKEQQKIADCLSSLDELIELQSRKVEILKQHKKGLMQQLFPQEVI